jgi:hypothetical protein
VESVTSINPALVALEVFVGTWEMELCDASFLPHPDTKVQGLISFEWIERGAALAMRQGDAASWIIGRDDAGEDFCVLYADGRGVSRVYTMSLSQNTWKLWRRTPEFSQRFEAELSADRNVLAGQWKKSFDGGQTWEHDFNVNYTRSSPANRETTAPQPFDYR